MFIIRHLLSFIRALPYRVNPALRFCKSLSIIRPCQFIVDKTSTLRCSVRCEEGSLAILGETYIAKGTEVNVGNNGSIVINKGVQIGKSSLLSAGCQNSIEIGEKTTFFSTVFLSGSISIGKECLFAQNIIILSGTHIINDRRPIRVQDAEFLRKHGVPPNDPVEIGDDCWIGMNAVILPGVKLGKGCVVGAGAVVTKDFSEYSIIGGVPAKLLGHR